MSRDFEAVCSRLIFEPTVYPVNGAYRKSFTHSLKAFVYYYVKSRNLRLANRLDLDSPALCFGAFPNELRALDVALQKNAGWRKVAVSLHTLEGLDWRAIMSPALRELPRFLWRIYRLRGWPAIRDFAYPFIGYLQFLHLAEVFKHCPASTRVVTTNLMHPLSVGAHLAAKQANLPTVFWEHAMTPKLVAKDMGYDQYHVNCSHTRESFIAAGVPESHVKLIDSEASWRVTPLGPADTLKTIGVAVNDLDDLRHIDEALSALKALGRTLVLRVHDSDKRFKQFVTLAERQIVRLSNAAQTPIVSFMREVDVIVAGNSNVVLDCLKNNMRVVYFWKGDPSLFDYYGIVSASKCVSATSIDGLKAIFAP